MKTKILPVIISAVFTGYVANSNAQANTSLSNLTSPTAINVGLLPGTDHTKNLGSSTNQWQYLYLYGRIYLNGQLSMQAHGTNNFFAGGLAGNTSVTGAGCTGIGQNALLSATSGNNNTAEGLDAMYSSTSGYNNVAMGVGALKKSTTGNYMVAVGDSALYNQIANQFNDYNNTAVGSRAMYANTTGSHNTAIGTQSLYKNTIGRYNTASGSDALHFNTTGNDNTAHGNYALYYNTTGTENCAFGSTALFLNNGNYNTATGFYALYQNSTGSANTANGNGALEYSTTANGNTANGFLTLGYNSTGNYNTAMGYLAMELNQTGENNVAMGYYAGSNMSDGTNNTFIGYNTNCDYPGHVNNTTLLGNGAYSNSSNLVRIGNNVVGSIGGYANWTNISDGRVKKNIKSNVPGLVFINKLTPVTYNLDLDAADKILQKPAMKDKDGKIVEQKPTATEIASRKAKEQVIYSGFIAQDVEKTAKELNYDFSGVDAAKNDKDLYGLRYAEFVVPLVKAVQELSAKNDELQKQNDAQQKVNSDLQQQINDLKAMISSTNSNSSQQDATNIILTSASLAQNIPNPFTHTTTINYTLPKQFVAAQILITDNSGKTVKQVAVTGTGKGTLNVDASSFASGTYQYSLVVDGKLIESKRMTLVK